MTRVILDVETGLSLEEVPLLKQLLHDALGEFVSARMGARNEDPDSLDSAVAYIMKRYPEMPVLERARKADEVRLRKAIARKLRAAASNVRVED